MKRLLVILALCSFLGGITPAQTPKDIQQLVLDETPTAFYAALPVYAWVDQEGRFGGGVIGTGFVVNNQGDFITAGHVASTTEVGSGSNKLKVRLTVGLRQKKAGISGMAFKIIEIDPDHDLALCHIEGGLHGVRFADSGLKKIAHPEQPGGFTAEEMSQPFASLAIDQRAPTGWQFHSRQRLPAQLVDTRDSVRFVISHTNYLHGCANCPASKRHFRTASNIC